MFIGLDMCNLCNKILSPKSFFSKKNCIADSMAEGQAKKGNRDKKREEKGKEKEDVSTTCGEMTE